MTDKNQLIEPRKQPSQARSAAMVDAILEAAARILKENNKGDLSTNHIAERAGVSVGSLYQYFPTKEAIFTQLIRRKRETLLRTVEEVLAQKDNEDFSQTTRHLIAAVITIQFEWPKLERALEQVGAYFPIEQETADLKQAIIEKIGEFLRYHAIEDPMTAAQDVVALARGMIKAAGLADESDQSALVERVSRAVEGYLSGQAAAERTTQG